MITPNEFKAILEIIIPRLIAYIAAQKKITPLAALELLYQSQFYKKLEIEETKLWHFGLPLQYQLLNEELTTGKITFPQEA